MKYLGTFETIKFKDLGVTYLKGILHTFADLNQPDSTLAYDYDIIEFKKGSDLITDIKSHFDLFSNRPITLELISNERFNEALKLWLFGTKLVSDFRMERYIDFFHHLLIDITGLKNILYY